MYIAIIGCGNMGSGIARRLSLNHSVRVYDRKEERTHEFSKEIKCKPCKSAAEAVKGADLIILAVKPKDLKSAAKELYKKIKPSQLLVSILAGITTDMLKLSFGDVPVLRMMPNMAVVHGQGVVALAEPESFSSKQKEVLAQTFGSLGVVLWLPEEMFDAVTSLTGSGPAFALVIIEAMIDAAIALGFKADLAKVLVLQMLFGTLSMVLETGKHPAELKWQITSPAGTTIAGLAKLEEAQVRTGIMKAFLGAFQRAKEISLQ